MIKISLACSALLTAVALVPGAALAQDVSAAGYYKRGYAAPYYRNAYRTAYRPRLARYYGPRYGYGYRPARAAAYAAATVPYHTYNYAAPANGYGYSGYGYNGYGYASAPVTYGYQTVTVQTNAVQQYTQPLGGAYYAAPAYYTAPAYYGSSGCCGSTYYSTGGSGCCGSRAYYNAGFALPFLGWGWRGGCGGSWGC
jgi:hypothetical protein